MVRTVHLIRTSPYYGQSTCISGDRLRIQLQLRDNICSLHRRKFEVWASGMTARYISLEMKFGKRQHHTLPLYNTENISNTAVKNLYIVQNLGRGIDV